MSHTVKYISLDSTYRNRTLFPNPNNFEVLFSDSGMKDRFNAIDPISDSVPLITFTTLFDKLTSNQQIVGTLVSSAIPIGYITSPNYIIASFTADSLQQQYNYYQGAVFVDTTTNVSSRITEYTFMETKTGSDYGQFKLETSLTNFSNGDAVVITNPTDVTSPTNLIFVPASVKSQNRYIDYFLYNNNTTESSLITDFNAITKMLTVATPITINSTDVLCIRKELPKLGTLVSVTSESVVTLPASFGVYPLVGGYLKISGIDSILRINSVDTVIAAPDITVTVGGNFQGLVAPAAFEFMAFTRDNFSPMVYSGSMLSQQEVSCYEIELIDLVLPNQVLNISNGGFISEHQYVFVELSNSNNPSTNVIYSNNPNSRNMLFKAAVPDILYPLITPFVRLLGTTDLKQTIKFKPNDNLKLSVRLPSGDVIQSSVTDDMSPKPPLDYLQLTVQFSIRKC